jgi:hypothetical protein
VKPVVRLFACMAPLTVGASMLAYGTAEGRAVEASGSIAPRWGYRGHEMAAGVAVDVLPEEVPAFFRDARAHLVYLAPEPDRWRDASRPTMDAAWSYDHYIDFENVPDDALDAVDRFAFLRRLSEAGLARPERDAGLLPYRIVELYERLVTEWGLWRDAPPGSDRRRWIEQRIVNDAGILAHYVTDGSQPQHTTIHFDGWRRDAPNPEGFRVERGFHAEFERFFVEAHVAEQEVRALVPTTHAPLGVPPRDAVLAYLRVTFATVPELYSIERDDGFDPGTPASDRAKEFAAERLAAGAEMLATLWWSAWREAAG